MIPKKIHYCWFGRNPLPDSALKCIASWKKFLPDYEIIEWNEDNFDVNSIPYTRQAYEAKKYAFVSDYARFKILYEHGGLYFDTDVEVIRPMDDILSRGGFMGYENERHVAPGLGMASEPGTPLYAEIINHYSTELFKTDTGFNTNTVGEHVTAILKRHGLTYTGDIQKIGDVFIYPPEWFNPLDDATGRLRTTKNTVSIHWYTKSWLDNNSALRTWSSRMFHRFFGVNAMSRIKALLHK